MTCLRNESLTEPIVRLMMDPFDVNNLSGRMTLGLDKPPFLKSLVVMGTAWSYFDATADVICISK